MGADNESTLIPIPYENTILLNNMYRKKQKKEGRKDGGREGMKGGSKEVKQ